MHNDASRLMHWYEWRSYKHESMITVTVCFNGQMIIEIGVLMEFPSTMYTLWLFDCIHQEWAQVFTQYDLLQFD
jgi:hypothetical protein